MPGSKFSWQAWLPAFSLACAGFIFVTTEMLPIGLLPDIAKSVGKSEATTGLLLTVYAWAVALLSLPLTALTSGWNRKTLVLALMAIFICGNALAAVASNFIFLMCARICIAFAHSVFWAITAPLAARVAPAGKKAKALGVIAAGTSLAVVLGVPFGTILGHYLGWRFTFGTVAGIGFCVGIILWRLLPSEPSANAGSFKSLPSLAKNKNLLSIYLLTLTAVIGHFTIFTYFSPFMQQEGNFGPQTIAMLLLVLGGAGIAGSIAGSKHAERPGKKILALPLLVLSALLALVPTFVSAGLAAAVMFCVIWGATFTFVTIVFQIRVLGCAPDYTDVATAIYSGTFNIGIGGGAFLGSLIFSRLGIVFNPYAAALFFGLAAAVSALSGATPCEDKPTAAAP